MIELLWLLLPVAAASGWYAASRNRGEAARSLNADYFRGINYLLNEQPDKAIEAFIRILEIDSETVETHLALGNLYRRRGEVDRAIRIHQNLIARTNLDEEQRVEALFELGQDYFSAGLLDRAEDIFRELVQHEGFRERSLRQIILVYEQEGDWKRAEEAARDLEQVTGSSSVAVPVIPRLLWRFAARRSPWIPNAFVFL
jgi:lipopolysaccharide biosynthesis regulator YciM